MAKLRFFVSAQKRQFAPIYLRFSDGSKYIRVKDQAPVKNDHGIDLIVKTGLVVEPDRWSNDTQTIKQRIRTEDDEKLIRNLSQLKSFIESSYKNHFGAVTKDWINLKIQECFNIKSSNDDTLNSYIDKFIQDAKTGIRKNKGNLNYSPGTIRTWEGFQRIFNEYQGVYTEDRIKEFKEKDKALRPLKKLDFEDINLSFYKQFVEGFLSSEGYQVNTIGRFVKALKYMMQKALIEKKHHNREFQEGAFSGFSEDSHAIYLTNDEIEKIYNHDLSKDERMDKARDAFIVLCETALRVSDYRQIDINIKEHNKRKFIHIYQTKTSDKVVIPLTPRMEAILQKYDGKLPRIPEQYVNKYIKTIAFSCGLTEKISWPAQKFGKKYTASAQKWELISCHTARRSSCTNMYKAGIPVIDIRKISGHRTEKSFLAYIRITPEETAERLAIHPYFSGQTALKVV